MPSDYHTVQNFDGENLDIFDGFQLDGQNLPCQILTIFTSA